MNARNLEQALRLLGGRSVGPDLFGLVPAVCRALELAGWLLGDVERIEINEAFAAVPLAIAKEFSIPEELTNVEGGAIAHGHLIDATGAVLNRRLCFREAAASFRV